MTERTHTHTRVRIVTGQGGFLLLMPFACFLIYSFCSTCQSFLLLTSSCITCTTQIALLFPWLWQFSQIVLRLLFEFCTNCVIYRLQILRMTETRGVETETEWILFVVLESTTIHNGERANGRTRESARQLELSVQYCQRGKSQEERYKMFDYFIPRIR